MSMLTYYLLFAAVISLVDAGVVIEGNLHGGEIAKGRWQPNWSILEPFAKKAEEALPDSSKKEVKKLSQILEHIHTPGCSWDLMVFK
jgi:hypothetical protein